MSRLPQPGEIYQHFKGNLYRIVTLAEHTETGEMLVVYQALYGDFRAYARPLSMFVSEVDHGRYPEVQAKLRFTLIPAAGNVLGNGFVPEAKTAQQTETPETQRPEEPEAKAVQHAEVRAEKTVRQAEDACRDGRRVESDADGFSSPHGGEAPEAKAAEGENDAASAEEEFELDPRLLAFLEADSYEKKLEVYASLAGKADESILNTIAVSLDLELSGDTLEEQYETLKNCLLTLEKYECNRLR